MLSSRRAQNSQSGLKGLNLTQLNRQSQAQNISDLLLVQYELKVNPEPRTFGSRLIFLLFCLLIEERSKQPQIQLHCQLQDAIAAAPLYLS